MITKCYRCLKVITTNSKSTLGGTIHITGTISEDKQVYFCSQTCKDYVSKKENR